MVARAEELRARPDTPAGTTPEPPPTPPPPPEPEPGIRP